MNRESKREKAIYERVREMGRMMTGRERDIRGREREIARKRDRKDDRRREN